MIRIGQIKLKPGHSQEELEKKVIKLLRVRPENLAGIQVVKRSVDARKKPELYYVYTVDAALQGLEEVKQVERLGKADIRLATDTPYRIPAPGPGRLSHPPVVIGTGPAGLFCGYILAKAGYRPILLERGADVDARAADVEKFWKAGVLDPESNVQFGEGGAGTFSDGKLNTLVKDKDGRSREVLRIFVGYGAPAEILYEAKPHIGTDLLTGVVKRMREQILKWGGQVRFRARVTDLDIQNGALRAVILQDGTRVETGAAVLAVGHSARDTFRMLYEKGLPMEAKAFAVGLRVQHPQSLIDLAQYGTQRPDGLPAASYKLTASAEGRGVYSFCMCPGGYVVNAGSEPGRVTVNGMSYSRRDGENANSAVIVSVTPDDYGSSGPLAGVAFQRRLEEKAWELGQGGIPVQRLGAFAKREGAAKKNGHISEDFRPCIKGAYTQADLRRLLPEELNRAFLKGMEQFCRVIPGFDDDAVWLAGVESRTSSPVRITRDDAFQSRIRGLYPCGEGAGYAGGIMSAAMDGMRIAEAIIASCQPDYCKLCQDPIE